MTTKLARRPYANVFSVGNKIDADWQDVSSACYIPIAQPNTPDTISLLQPWDCCKCKKAFNWAIIDIANGVLVSIAAVQISINIVQRVNYISDLCQCLLDPPDAPFEPFNGEKILSQLLASLAE